MDKDEAREGSTQDTLFGGALRLAQPRFGHRAGTDGVILAAMTPPGARLIADMGASSGLVGLRAAQLNPDAHVLLIERDASLAALARQNILDNGLGGRVDMREADVFLPSSFTDLREAFDTVLTNPPFYDLKRIRISRHAKRVDAHVFDPACAGLEGWTKAAATLTAPHGICAFIYHPHGLGALLPAFMRRFGDVKILPVHAKSEGYAIRILIYGKKGSRAPLTILSPLILHEDDGRFTAYAERLHRGEARIAH